MTYQQEHPDFMQVPSSCGCMLPEGHRGTGGWHFEPSITLTETPASVAYERCPSYWKAAGRKIDPTDKTRLMSEAIHKRRGRKAIAG